ncbi:MAG: sulfur oxidation c-type cytochrome SoxA [Methylococcales bacterium]
MIRIFSIPILILTLCTQSEAEPMADLQTFREYYFKIFPDLSLVDYANGVYAINEDAKQSWEAIEEFPPYEIAIDEGKLLFQTPFKNGKRYRDCFSGKGLGIANQYPKWDQKQAKVITLALAINQCRLKNNEPPLPYKKGAIANILAYMAYSSRGKPTQIVIPPSEPGALSAYEKGKEFYYSRRGQLNFSCATCHIDNAGRSIRAETLSPALGHTTGWPVYRLKWGEIGTLHRRFAGCNRQVRAQPLEPQSEEYRNLEYFLSYMSNDIPVNGPSTRK